MKLKLYNEYYKDETLFHQIDDTSGTFFPSILDKLDNFNKNDKSFIYEYINSLTNIDNFKLRSLQLFIDKGWTIVYNLYKHPLSKTNVSGIYIDYNIHPYKKQISIMKLNDDYFYVDIYQSSVINSSINTKYLCDTLQGLKDCLSFAIEK